MAAAQPTWIVLARDVSDSVEIEGQRSTHLATVIEVGSGLFVSTVSGTAADDTVRRALKSALTRPAAPLKKAIPERLVCLPELVDVVRAGAATLSWLADATIVEAAELMSAEETFDALVGHTEGRDQPEYPPDVADWSLLYAVLEDFVEAEPWHRWSDSDYFPTSVSLDDQSVDWFSIILGGAGIQIGFNVLPDPEDLERAAEEGEDPLEHLENALIVHFDPWRECFGVLAAKAKRYGWPLDAKLVPRLLTVRGAQPADLSQTDARLLILAIRGVLEQDAKSLVVAGAPPVGGELRFGDGVTGSFEVARP